MKKTGANLILEERKRQIQKEGFTEKHDDQHIHGEMAYAAACYTLYAADSTIHNSNVPVRWPWNCNDWKPAGGKMGCLIKAGALIAAEIDRLQRLNGEKK